MMFTTLSAKYAGMKTKVLAAAAVAGAAMLMAAPVAQAQHVRFGVTIGAPVYVAPAPYVAPGTEMVFAGPGYYDGIYFRDYDAWRAHYGWGRPQRFDRDRVYARSFDRDRHVERRFDRR